MKEKLTILLAKSINGFGVCMLILLSFSVWPVYSQQGFFPVMKVSNLQKGEVDPMRIDELKIDVKVLGQIAVTTMEISYFNSNSRVMEGEFNFPLDEGQTVSRFALDINGQMREGVVVEKEAGRKTFEAIARRQVDPGLLEKTAGNNFRARVFPLPANGYRRIIIAYEQELTERGQGYLYRLPLTISNEIRSFSVHAEVIKQQVKFNIAENELTSFEFKQWNDSYVADFKQENFVPNKQIAFLMPSGPKNVLCYTEPLTENSDSSYYYLNYSPKRVEREKVLPTKIALFWDNSNSSLGRSKEKEIQALGDYLRKIGNLKVELVPFNIKPERSRVFDIVNGNWADLKMAIEEMVYDGGTSFGAIDFSRYSCDEILLFSDGISNFGASTPAFSKVPVIVVNSNVVANHSFLTYISQRSGGQYINLAKLTVDEALSRLLNSDYHFISAVVINGNISNVFPSTPTQFDKSFSQAGVLKGASAVVALNFGYGNTVVHSDTVTVSADRPYSTGILRRVWAQKKLATLSINEETNKDEITRLGKEYGIVTANTSLIVLEALNDYLQYRITPPKELQEEYYSKLSADEKSEKDKVTKHIEYVAGLFAERIKWWNKEFPKEPIPTPKYSAQVKFVAPVVVEEARVEDNSFATRDEAEVVQNEDVSVVTTAYGVRRTERTLSAKVEGSAINEVDASIELNAWDPQTPYLKVLQYAAKGQEYGTYLKLKGEYGTTPFFYVDASDFFFKAGSRDTAVRILSNLAEMKLEEPNLMRILGQKLQQFGCTSEAVEVFKIVLKLKGEEPQSYRDLGLAHSANGENQLAINALYEVVKREWDGRFSQIELIALEELNNIISQSKEKLDISAIDSRLIKNLTFDVRVVLSWDTDNCDMDLWVTDPYNEKCFYSDPDSRIGGHMSPDITRGYGPEEFLIRKAVNGKYKVEVNYYGTRSQKIFAPVTLHLKFYTNFGKYNQKVKETTIRLTDRQDVIDVGKFSFVAMPKQVKK